MPIVPELSIAENKAKDISDTSDEKEHQLFQATVTVLQSMPAVAYCEAYKQKHHADTRPEYRLKLEILNPRRIESEIQYKYQTRMKTRNTEPKEN